MYRFFPSSRRWKGPIMRVLETRVYVRSLFAIGHTAECERDVTLKGGKLRPAPYGEAANQGQIVLPDVRGLVARAGVFLPGAGINGVVLPFFAAAYKEHDEAEDEHDGSPSEIEVDAHGFFVDVRGVAGDETVDAHEAADEQEDEAEGDADV
jgi:hypothetical protein